jgi:hypothetical protein
MGRISARFKADGKETGGRYAISEWAGAIPGNLATEMPVIAEWFAEHSPKDA